MKKMITIVFILGAMSLLYQFFVLFIMNQHEADYSIKTETNSYMLEEAYHKKDGFNIYNLKIEDKDKKVFVASFDKSLNRQSRIVKDIKEYQANNLYCIAPVFKDRIVDNVLCLFNNNQVSVSYLHQIGNSDIDIFINNLRNDGYDVNNELDKSTNIVKIEDNISIYDGLDENMFTTIWGYKNLYILNNKEIIKKDLLSKDSYFNDYGILCGKYYVTMNSDDSDFISFYVVNVKDGGKAKIDFDYAISKNSYFNGIYDGKIYLTDIGYSRQYVINPATEKIEEVGTSKECKYFDGESLKNVNISNLTSEKRYFVPKKIEESITSKYKDYFLIESYGNYYYQDSNGSVYQVVGNYSDYKVLLFQFNDFKELKLVHNNLFGISKDTIYMYNNSIGLRKVATYRELNYNYKNMYDIYYS